MNFKHGKRRSRTYRIWTHMKDRCGNPNSGAFKDYGARGIHVCQRWTESFSNFIDDMGECPDGLSIERLNNDAGYELGNCVWADRKSQNRNRRGVRMLTANGKTMSIGEWSDETGIKLRTICQRLRIGWTEQAAVSTPVRAFGAGQGVRFTAPEYMSIGAAA